MAEPKNIYEALNAVMSTVGYVQKQRTAGLNYSYAGEAALIAAIRPAMVEHGVVVHPAGVHDLTSEQFTNKNGTVMTRVCGIFRFTFSHGPSGTSFDVEVVGEGVDSGDKAANKAMTGAFKYALRQSLMIETGDDPDSTSSAEQERSTGKPTNAKPVNAPAAPKTNGTPSPAPAAEKAADTPTNKAGVPDASKFLTGLTGEELYQLQQNAPKALGLNEFNYRARMKNHFGKSNPKEIDGLTVGEFIQKMGVSSTGEAEPEKKSA